MITELKKKISSAFASLPNDYQGELYIHNGNIFSPVYVDGKVDTKNYTPHRYISVRCIRTDIGSSVDPYKNEIERYLIAASPANVKLLIDEIDRLSGMEKEVEHWKNNHACEVARARVLKERPDMPLERIKAYDRMVELEKENQELKNKLAEATGQERCQMDMISYQTFQIKQDTDKLLQYMKSHFKEPGYY